MFEFLKKFFNINNFKVPQVMPTFFEEKRCITCGTTMTEILYKSRLGCPYCYTFFKEELLPIIKKVQYKCNHTGKRTEIKKENTIEELKQKLEEYIKLEQYEKANEINKIIKELTIH